MNSQTAEQPIRLTIVQGGLCEVGETELPYAMDLRTLLKKLMNEADQMTPSEK